jgi:hypothetical protein
LWTTRYAPKKSELSAKTDSIALPPTPNQPDFSNAVFTSLPRDQHGGPSKDHAGDGDRELALPAKRPAEAGRLC